MLLVLGAGHAVASTVWTNYPPAVSPAENLTDALAGGSDILGVRLNSGTLEFRTGNTYSGGTEILGGVCYPYGAPASPFGSGPVSIQGGRLQANGNLTVTNNVTIDGDFSFGCGNVSTPDDDISFSAPVVLTGNRTLTAYDGDGSDVDLFFLAGIQDGGNGYSLTLMRAANADYSGYISLGSGSTYSGATIVHGGVFRLNGALSSTSEIRVNNGGQFQLYWSSSGTDDRLDNSVPGILRGGTLAAYVYQGSGSQWESTETVGIATFDYGHSTIQAGATRARVTLTVSNLVCNAGSSAYFYRYGGSETASFSVYGYGRLKLTGEAAGFMGGWAIARRNEYMAAIQEDRGYDFAWYDTGTARLSGVLPMSLSAEPRPTQVEGGSAGDHVSISSAQTTLTGSTSINSLHAGGVTNNLGGFQLDIVSGGLMVTGGVYSVTNGTLTSSGGHLYLYNLGGTLNVNVPIVGASLGVSTVGSMTLAEPNTFGGDLYVNDGTLTLATSNTFGKTANVAPGATLDVDDADGLSDELTLSLKFDGEDYGIVNLDASVTVCLAQTNEAYLAAGNYTSGSLPNYITGAGTLTVLRSQPASASGTVFRFQ